MTGGDPTRTDEAWRRVLAHIIDQAHLLTGDHLSTLADEAVQPVGLTAQILVADLAQECLTPLSAVELPAIDVEGTVAGRAYQLGEIVTGTDDGERLLWIPLLDGTERVGVLRVGLGADTVEDDDLRRRCWSVAGLLGHLFMAKIAYSDRLHQLRTNGRLSLTSELLWQLVPPRTVATERVVVTAILEPHDEVAGDAYDYSIDAGTVHVAVYDGVGHDLQAGQTTALALTATRNARRAEQTELDDMADQADRLISSQAGRLKFVTAVLARLDVETGMLHYLLAGHPAPLLVRNGRVVKRLDQALRPPLGISPRSPVQPAHEHLEPGDRVLFYSDGITEARDPDGEYFGESRLVDFTERAALSRLPAPETLRRLSRAVMAHQSGELQDDATLLLLDWRSTAVNLLLPDL